MSMMKNGYTVDFANGSVEMTKAFAKKAGVYGSNEYKILMGLRKDFPDLTVSVAEKKAKSTSGMTYENMKTVIGLFDNATKRLANFDRICKISKLQSSPYKYVKEWFLNNYGEVTLDQDGKPVVKPAKADQDAEEEKNVLPFEKGFEKAAS